MEREPRDVESGTRGPLAGLRARRTFLPFGRARANASLLRRWIPRARCARRERERPRTRAQPHPHIHRRDLTREPSRVRRPKSHVTQPGLRKSRPDMTDLDDHSALGQRFSSMRARTIGPSARHAASNRATAVPPRTDPSSRRPHPTLASQRSERAQDSPHAESFCPIFPCRTKVGPVGFRFTR